jgi:3-hydroxyacyl-CoA dehydrogenase
LEAYLNGTGAAPTTVAITGAGNDGEGHAYFFAPGASINVQTFDGKTFYAVWSKIE